MDERFPGNGAAANGFGRHWMCPEEATLLFKAGYPVSPDNRFPDT